MYSWRKMTEEEQKRVLGERKHREFPKPPHFDSTAERQYLISAACYEHKHLIGKSIERMTEFESLLLTTCKKFTTDIYAWCVLPNHYHVLLKTENIKAVRKEL